ncbi:hypothetical protein HFN_2222 [Helicobacter fennelliae MRY12-0050]|uniref:Uncharacterized protein n=1 Tax=Helicobacter fennelliae MRY12-0050 TaxID=1325130 RepID=T1CXY2_9HELI|nr:hypothetical protein HFN_2222 [Helicobacter fennelliae MRY12-0050]
MNLAICFGLGDYKLGEIAKIISNNTATYNAESKCDSA